MGGINGDPLPPNTATFRRLAFSHSDNCVQDEFKFEVALIAHFLRPFTNISRVLSSFISLAAITEFRKRQHQALHWTRVSNPCPMMCQANHGASLLKRPLVVCLRQACWSGCRGPLSACLHPPLLDVVLDILFIPCSNEVVEEGLEPLVGLWGSGLELRHSCPNPVLGTYKVPSSPAAMNASKKSSDIILMFVW